MNNNTQVSLTNSSTLLNQLIEYILLKELSLVTVDYFNNPKFKDSKINKISKNDVPNLFTSNEFLILFSKPMSERVAFNNKENPSIVLSYAPNGAIYERFELTLPKKSKIHKKGSNVIEIILFFN